MSERVYVDSSVLVALLAHEEDRATHVVSLRKASRRYTSAVSFVESVMVLSSLMGTTPKDTENILQELLTYHEIDVLPADQTIMFAAVRAFEQFGKGRHPARLNLGDCFSYACAKQHRLKLLYKGNDFAQTDLG